MMELKAVLDQSSLGGIESYLRIGNRAHLIGIGGSGMNALAKVLKHAGLEVTGSDLAATRATEELGALGIPVWVGHEREHVRDPDFLVYSSAIPEANPERSEASSRGIPVFKRAEVLAALTNRGISIGVTGTHGKTTTSALISFLLAKTGYRPTCLVGSRMIDFDSNVLLGDLNFFVSEVDESDRTHLLFRPDIAVLTNLEADHLDVYGDFQQLKAAFRDFVAPIKTSAAVVFSGHDQHLSAVTREAERRIDFGLAKTFRFGAEDLVFKGLTSSFNLFEAGKSVARVSLSVPGTHNVLNALAALAALRSFGIPWEPLLAALPVFRGTSRRLEVKYESDGIMVIDDYAHHPTEVEAGLRALRSLGKPVTVVFQPHRFSRVHHLGQAFAGAFRDADRVILTDIYAAHEENAAGIDMYHLYRLVKGAGHPDVSVMAKDEIMDSLMAQPKLEGVIAFFGAGDISGVAHEFAARLRRSCPK
jgi:UDP-N-acetylmuramate--alanine ligase